MLSVALLAAGVLFVSGFLTYAVSVYNNLVRLSRTIDQSFSNIDVILKQRRDEILKLVDTCKAYMTHERSLLEEITRLRAGYADARTTDQKVGIENRLNRAFRRLLITLEAYPDLKAIQSVMQVQSRITALESNIADRRELFNDAVTRHNIYTDQFPPILIARILGYRERALLEIPEHEKADVVKPFTAA